jgi:prepilin-type N-terminal cleavage/methylation domain-containing protein
MRTTRRHAVTLVELLVTLAVVGVMMVGLGSLYSGAASDFAMTSRLRERRFSREQLESELTWRLKAVPSDCLPTNDFVNANRISFADEKGVAARDVLAFDYFVNDTRINVDMPADPTDPPAVLVNGLSITGRIQPRTGLIFQHQTNIYMFERAITAGNPSFRAQAPYQGFVDSQVNRDASRLLAIGIDELDFEIEAAPRRVRWTIRQN